MISKAIPAIVLLALAGAGGWWLGQQWNGRVLSTSGSEDAHGHDHGEHAHAEGSTDSIALSEQAVRNLGIVTGAIELTEHWNSISVPATVVEQPGHSFRRVAAPLAGIVRDVFIHPSQLIRPGDRIAELELTGDSLAITQGELLKVVQELEVNQKELDRVEKLVAEGSLPERNLLEIKYERRRLEIQRESKIQQLLILGLSSEQVEEIQTSQKMVRSFVVTTPEVGDEIRSHLGEAPKASELSYTVEAIEAFPGKRVQIGDELCSLAFHTVLFLEGQAFEREGRLIEQSMKERLPITARFETGGGEPLLRKDLQIQFMGNNIEAESRTIRFFLALPNEIAIDNVGPLGETYRSWVFKPGQKARLEVPVERMKDVIVLPADSVARDGLEDFVFRANGKRFERQRVTVLSRSQDKVVLANDGNLFPGEHVALNNAFQLNLAVKMQSGQGGGGHSHDHAH